MVDVLLEGTRSIGQSKGGDKPFKEPVTCSESCLPLISFFHSDLVEGSNDIQLGKELGFADLVQGFLDQWQWIAVFPGDLVKATVVHAKPQPTSWLFDKQHRSSCRGLAHTNEPFVQ